MSKFGTGLGIWEVKLGEVEYKLEPTMDDIFELRKGLSQATDRKAKKIDLGILDKTVFNIYEKLVLKADPNLTLQDKKELKEYITINLTEITEDMMIALKQTTKEAMEKAKEEEIEEDKKKL